MGEFPRRSDGQLSHTRPRPQIGGRPGDIDLPMDVLRRVASPSGIVGLLLLVAARAPERRTLEEPGA
jgi:hypothetical protein